VKLEWATASEVNNFGFYVQRRASRSAQWSEIPNSFQRGHGTTNEPQRYEFTDGSALVGNVAYRLRQLDLDGSEHFSEAIQVDVLTDVKESAPMAFQLMPNYPNPFNPETTIKFSVETLEHAKLEVYNTVGQRVATLFDRIAEPGYYYKVKFDGNSLSSGVYFYRLQSGKKNDLKKLLLVK
jgi:hypothetical protein